MKRFKMSVLGTQLHFYEEKRKIISVVKLFNFERDESYQVKDESLRMKSVHRIIEIEERTFRN